MKEQKSRNLRILLLLMFLWVFRKQLRLLWTMYFTIPEATLAEPQNKLIVGTTYEESTEHENYTVRRVIENGIERISYLPKKRKYDTPLLFQHGMWHGAWCWQWWQEQFAEWGWESHAISLPGHAGSPVQRPIAECTLDYYLSFLKTEVDRYETKPVLMGHSMGGAISQWYLKYVGDDLPAVVLVASWVAHSAIQDGMPLFLQLDPVGVIQASFKGDATPYVRNPTEAAAKLISPGAMLTSYELHEQLSPESLIVTMQHNPPMWHPAENIKTPMLYLAGEIDAVVSLEGAERTAKHYGADYIVVEKAAHNLMMEHNYAETAQQIHDWLNKQGIK